jgi:hypothetical protein
MRESFDEVTFEEHDLPVIFPDSES